MVILLYAFRSYGNKLHIASLAIFVGGFSSVVPSRTKDLASLGSRALSAATLACLMTGAVAGFFYIIEGLSCRV
ncbi:MAG: hypothetical protein KAS70_03450 [Planctomycetes bacterium]|nr:hypothetical protein [Planctomycetota bacterium]